MPWFQFCNRTLLCLGTHAPKRKSECTPLRVDKVEERNLRVAVHFFSTLYVGDETEVGVWAMTDYHWALNYNNFPKCWLGRLNLKLETNLGSKVLINK